MLHTDQPHLRDCGLRWHPSARDFAQGAGGRQVCSMSLPLAEKQNFDAHPTRGRGRWVAAAPIGRCYVSPSATDPWSDFANMCYNSGRRKPHLTPASSGRASARAAGGGVLIGTRRSVRAARPVAQGTAQRVRLPSPPRLRRSITQGGDTAREARTIRSAAMRDACTPGTHCGAPPSQPECACRIARPGRETISKWGQLRRQGC